MPEGDVVWRAARRLHEALAGSTLTASDFRVSRLATTDLTGRQVRAVLPRGKHLLIRLGPDLTLHTHLQMEGEWRLYRPGARFRGPLADIRLVLGTEAWVAVGYRLPVIELLPTAEEGRVVGHLGPDLLGPDWDEGEALRRLAEARDREIGDALVDQQVLAGVGNLYKSEALFLRGLSPWCRVSDAGDLPGLVRLAQRLLDANKDRAGQVTTGVARRGEQTWVYGRAGRPCRRCGTRIRRAHQGRAPEQRVTFWCPHCQPRDSVSPHDPLRSRRRGR